MVEETERKCHSSSNRDKFIKKKVWNRWKGKMLKEIKANALQSLTIGRWMNGLRLLHSKDEENCQRHVLRKAGGLLDNWRPKEWVN